MAAPFEYLVDGGGGGDGFPLALNGGGASGAIAPAPAALVGANVPTQRFDIGVVAGLRPQDKYLGRNLVSDIQSSYETYITGSPVGRGGRYAVDAARRYGTTLTEAARGYLVAAGIPTLADILPDTSGGTSAGGGGGDTGGGGDYFPLPVPGGSSATGATDTTPFRILADELRALFGNAVYNPPLQSQATGYTPFEVSAAPGATGPQGGVSLAPFLLLGGVAIAGYFIYKKVRGA